MQKVGWIKVYRKIQENWIWLSDEPYCMRSAWDYLLLNSYFEDTKITWKKQVLEIKRGQMITSLRELSQEWKWSTGKVTRFLNRLEKENMIIKEDVKNGTLLTIINYEIYQDKENSNETLTKQQRNTDETPTEQKENTNGTGTKQERNTIKENKEDNNIQEEKKIEEDKKKRSEEEKDIHKAERERIINYFNLRCNTNYRPNSKDTKEKVNARLAEGFTEEDFYLVIDKKANEWMGTEYEKFLTPETLFRPSKFEKYLNQNIVKPQQQTPTKAQQKLEESRDMMWRWAEQED